MNTTNTEDPPTPVATTPTATTFFENYNLAQNSLRQTAQSLDAAFERLRELRRILLTYQQTMASHANRSPTVEPGNDFGPSHSALVLTDNTSDDSASAANSDPPLYITATPLQWSEMSPFRFIGRHPAVYDRQNGSASPSDDNTTPVPPTHARSRPLSDDSSTTLARRLAARQNPSARHNRSQLLGSVIDMLRTSRNVENSAPLVDLGPDLEAASRNSRMADIVRQRREIRKDIQFSSH